jgi:hypothetical protein
MPTTAGAPCARPGAGKRPSGVSTGAVLRDGLDLGKIAEKSGGKEAGGPAVKLFGSAALDDPPLLHQHDPVGDAHGVLGVVSDDDRGRADLLQQRHGLVAHHIAQTAVEIGEGLVHQQHAGPRRHSAGQRDALLLAARQHVRIGLGEVGEADAGDGAQGRRIGLGIAIAAQAEADVLAYRKMRKERVVLEDEADTPRLWLNKASGR